MSTLLNITSGNQPVVDPNVRKPDQEELNQSTVSAARQQRWDKYAGRLDTIAFITHRLPRGLKDGARQLLLHLRDKQNVWWNDISSEVVIYHQPPSADNNNNNQPPRRQQGTTALAVEETTTPGEERDLDIYDTHLNHHTIRGSNITDIVHHALEEGLFEPLGYSEVYPYMPTYVTKPKSDKQLQQQLRQQKQRLQAERKRAKSMKAVESRMVKTKPNKAKNLIPSTNDVPTSSSESDETNTDEDDDDEAASESETDDTRDSAASSKSEDVAYTAAASSKKSKTSNPSIRHQKGSTKSPKPSTHVSHEKKARSSRNEEEPDIYDDEGYSQSNVTDSDEDAGERDNIDDGSSRQPVKRSRATSQQKRKAISRHSNQSETRRQAPVSRSRGRVDGGGKGTVESRWKWRRIAQLPDDDD